MSKPTFRQRDQIYVIGPNQDSRLASVAPGKLITGIEFQMDPDAPFLLRGRAYRVSYNSLASRTQVGLQNVAMRFTGPDTSDFRSAALVPQNLQMPYGGQSAAWKPVYPQIPYPARATLTMEVLNQGSTTLTNLTFYFRGVKLFPWGSGDYTYPKRMSQTQYAYGINWLSPQNPANPTAAIQNLLTSDTRLLQTFQTKNDADFVIRSIQVGPSYAPYALETFFIFRDENRKAYSNDFVHFEMYGPSGGNYQTGASGSVTAVGTGNSLPGTPFPEWYLPKNHVMYYDIMRADSGYAGAATIPNFPVTLMGSRIYEA